VQYGSTHESRLSQQARLTDGNKNNVYGGATWRDGQGNVYEVTGRSDKAGHTEQHLMDEMRRQVADRLGIPRDRVDLSQMTDVKLFVEYSPCDTAPRWCQQDLADVLPQAQVSYSWPWNPRDVRDQSRRDFATAITTLFQRGSTGEI